MSNNPPANVANGIIPQSPRACHLMKIPLELRDIIYGMLLTTPYCTEVATDSFSLTFRLHTAILSVNKQISAEAARVLYQGNDFIVLTETRIFVDWERAAIPKFKLLSENQIRSPVLRIDIASRKRDEHPSRTLITTLEGLQLIIRFLWHQQVHNRNRRGDRPFHVSLILDFNLQALSRHRVLSEAVLRPWEKVCVKELVLTGDISEPMREHLEKCVLEGPFPTDVTAHFMEYSSLAEQEFSQRSYDAARLWWRTLEDYWAYVSEMRLYNLGRCRTSDHNGGIRDVLRRSESMLSEALLKHVKALLRESNYEEVIAYTDGPLGIKGTAFLHFFGPHLARFTVTKLELSRTLAGTALGKIEAVKRKELLKWAAKDLWYGDSRIPNEDFAGMGLEDLTKELTLSVNNELIRLQSLWRCGHTSPLSPAQQNGPLWEISVVRRSFWEWMDLLPEELAFGWG